MWQVRDVQRSASDILLSCHSAPSDSGFSLSVGLLLASRTSRVIATCSNPAMRMISAVRVLFHSAVQPCAEVIGAITMGMLVKAQQDVHARRSLKRAGGFNAICLRVVLVSLCTG